MGRKVVALWLVEERVQWDDTDGQAGITQVSFVRRLPSLTREEFARHWSEVHAPLARRHHPGLARYVQNVVVEPAAKDVPDIDGIAELTFLTEDDFRNRYYDSPEGKAIIRDDVARFIDRTSACGFVLR